MPVIIGNSSPDSPLRNMFQSLGDAFNNQSAHEVQRQHARRLQAENEGYESAAREFGLPGHDVQTSQGLIRAGHPDQANNLYLHRQAINANGNVDYPQLQTAQIGAHEPITSTAVGQRRTEAAALERQHAQDVAAMAREQEQQRGQTERQGMVTGENRYQFENTPEATYTPEGVGTYAPRKDLTSGNYQPAANMDQVLANETRKALAAGPFAPAAPAPAATRAAGPAAPPGGFTEDPVMEHLSQLPPALLAAKPQLLAEVRAYQLKKGSSQPLPPPPTEQPQAALDAAATSGPMRILQEGANRTSGTFGGPEVGANRNRAGENLDQLGAQLYSALSNIPGRSALADRLMQQHLIPHPGESLFGLTGWNADQAMHDVNRLTSHIRRTVEELQQENAMPGLDPKTVETNSMHIARLRGLLQQYEALPAKAARGVGPPEQPAATRGAPAAAASPPAGFKQAADGQWYAPDPSRPGKFVMWKP